MESTDAWITQLKQVLQQNEREELLVQLVNSLLSQIHQSEHHRIPSMLDSSSVERLMRIRHKLNLGRTVKDDWIWWFYHSKVGSAIFPVDNTLLNKIIETYQKEPSEGLASVVSGLFKRDLLTVAQVDLIASTVANKEIQKRVVIYRAEKDITDGRLLNRDQIQSLLSLRAYDTLNKMLDRKAFAPAGLELFEEPQVGESDSKHKRKLYERAKQICEDNSL